MLSAKFSLRDVDDVEAFAIKVAGAHARAQRMTYTHAEHEDLVAFLIAKAWEISEFSYSPAKGLRFSTHLYRTLRLRCIDYDRKTRGRTRWTWSSRWGKGDASGSHTYERQAIQFESLNAERADGITLEDALVDVRAVDTADYAIARVCAAEELAGRTNRDA